MVEYGTGERGDLHVSSDTTLSGQILHFDDLFVDSGVTLTVPHRTNLFVRDSLEVDGTLRVAPSGNAPTDAAGDTNAGSGGGSLNIIAFNIVGSGSIEAPGEDGTSGSNSPTADGTPTTVAHESVNVTPAIAKPPNYPGQGNERTDGGSSLAFDFGVIIENRLVTRPRVSKVPWQHISAGSGAAVGGEDGGGSGGGNGGQGGYGNYGENISESHGGGGAGGFIFVTTQNENRTVTYRTPGGDGSTGGGGGGGGIVVGYTDAQFVFESSGGAGGAAAMGGGSDLPAGGDGADGFGMHLPLENVL